MEFGKLIKAQNKISINKIKEDNKLDKNALKDKFEKINSKKLKSEPREFSAKIKPKVHDKDEKNKFKRDPRFDNISGELNIDMYNQNYSFVKEEANKYLDKIKQIKSKKKKLDDQNYSLIQKQVNLVKGWIKSKDYKDMKINIEQDIKRENKERKSVGLNPIYLKKNQMKKIVEVTKNENRSEQDERKYLKRKKHKESLKSRKIEKL